MGWRVSNEWLNATVGLAWRETSQRKRKLRIHTHLHPSGAMATQLHLRGGADRGALHAYTLPPNGVANMAEGVKEETWPREQLALVDSARPVTKPETSRCGRVLLIPRFSVGNRFQVPSSNFGNNVTFGIAEWQGNLPPGRIQRISSY